MAGHLTAVYGPEIGRQTLQRLQAVIGRYGHLPSSCGRGTGDERELSQKDCMLITYPDQLREPGVPPLRTLGDFCEQHLPGIVSAVHLLPFYPWSSDDGFAVKDYRAVDSALGTWDEVTRLGRHFRLMFDAVINHASAHSEWFQGFLRDDPRYREFFITVVGDPDLAGVVRPRALPLLTEFKTPSGRSKVWTTFSADQVDLNYRNPEVLLEIVDLLLFYAARGAQFIRLDAIAYLWKEIGTPCVHLPQTHHVIQLLRAALDEVAPHVMLITETNVPHAENVSYFGDGTDEAQLVYNFSLPLLLLHTFRAGEARTLSQWAASLRLPSDRVTFFNFLASHDGLGLNPVRGLLSEADIDALLRQTLAHGGRVSYKHNPDGSQSPYELNINYFDALSNPAGPEPLATQVKRFMAAQTIMLALPGVPGLYFHSLFGSRGWPQGVQQTGHHRTINRQKLARVAVERELADPTSLRHLVFTRYAQLLRIRAASPAFHPRAAQRIADYGASVFAVERTALGGAETVVCLHSVSAQAQWVAHAASGVDLISNERMSQPIHLAPYQSCWLKLDA